MKTLLNFTFLFLSLSGLTQDLKRVKEKHKFGIVSLEEFQVLKSDRAVKQGYYKAFNTSDEIIIEGNYEGNKKTGLWKFYNFRGELIQEFNYSTNKLISHTLEPAQEKFDVLINGTFKNTEVDSAPILVGGEIYQVLMISGFGYPKTAKDKGIQGQVIISFLINKEGHATNFEVLNSLDPEVDNEILNALKNLEHKWIAATIDTKNVTVKKIFVMNLTLK